jgi:fatty-acyl-CoA synthase
VPGEIVYRSPQLADGHWDKPADTKEAFRDGWFHSADLVRRDEEGYIFVVGRIKDVINTGGVLVVSREVEDAESQAAARP